MIHQLHTKPAVGPIGPTSGAAPEWPVSKWSAILHDRRRGEHIDPHTLPATLQDCVPARVIYTSPTTARVEHRLSIDCENVMNTVSRLKKRGFTVCLRLAA